MGSNRYAINRLMATTLLASVCLAGCVTTETTGHQTVLPGEDSLSLGMQHLKAGDYAKARNYLSDATARRPNDPYRQTLLALSWSANEGENPEAQELALVGYKTALSFQENAYWPAVLAGNISLDRGRYADALDYFARAVLARPTDPDAFEGLAVAAYQFGDVVLAREAARKATELKPESLIGWRISALSQAALNDPAGAQAALDQYVAKGGSSSEVLKARSANLLRTVALDDYSDSEDSYSPDKTSLNQVSVDVTILLSQTTTRDLIGLNLLDGLRLQYSGQGQRTTTNLPGANTFEAQTTLSQTIAIPELTWNLNLFNRFGQYYQVAARPSLTAYLGESSDFFIGRTLQVGVRGIESGQLEQVDIGIRLTVTPIEINEGNVIVKIETGRSFVTTDQAGTFAEALSTFRQEVSATAEVAFGNTLVLSGLSETVRDATSSKVPGLGDLPGLGTAFNERSTTERRDSVLVLLTPSRPVSFATEPWLRPEGVKRLVTLWSEVIDPSTSGQYAAERLSRMRVFRRMEPGDVPQHDKDRTDVGKAISSLLNMD